MPGEPREVSEIIAADFNQRLRRDHDLDGAAIIKLEQITGAQHHRLGKHESDRRSVDANQMGRLHTALLAGKDEAVDRRGSGARHKDTNNTAHDLI